MMIARIGRSVLSAADEFLYGLGFFARVLKESALFFKRGRVGRQVLVMQILFTGVEALGIAAAMALVIGAAIDLIGLSLLAGFGQGKLMYTILVIVIARELGPLLTAFIVIARSGTAIATEVGGMAVGNELEAYVAVGVDPISYIAAPRFLGVAISMLILYVYFLLFGLVGSYAVVTLATSVGAGDYFSGLFSAFAPRDVLIGLGKSLVFGVIISVVSLYRGFAVERASTEVPVAGIKAVGSGFMLCILADVVMIAMEYLG
jgi:ABC-type transport system involved in resistance to organic solvents, permease component